MKEYRLDDAAAASSCQIAIVQNELETRLIRAILQSEHKKRVQLDITAKRVQKNVFDNSVVQKMQALPNLKLFAGIDKQYFRQNPDA